MAESEFSITVISAHFGDEFWIRQLIERLNRFKDPRVGRVLVVNQNRDKQELKIESQIPLQVLEFPRNEREIQMLGHDHPSAISRAVSVVADSTTAILIMDSDCLPISGAWLESLGNLRRPVLASDPKAPGLTHPCFMYLPPGVANKLDFSEGQLTLGFDTGRLVGLQCAQQGLDPIILPAHAANWGKGTMYAAGSLYHHGSGSMLSSSDSRLNRQVVESQELHIRKRLLSGGHSRTASDLWFRLLALLAHGARALKR